jgi:DNA-binding transcriptional regulator YbjK
MAKDSTTGTESEANASRGRASGSSGRNRGELLRWSELLQIAADLFAEHGYAATTVRDIAEVAGMRSGSLYHHFDSKESMIDEILSTFINQTLDAYETVIAEGGVPGRRSNGSCRSHLSR